MAGGPGTAGGAGGTGQEPVIVVIAADPRVSGRAFEAMRIAVGIVSGENDVVLILTGPGVHLLDADTDELIDGDDIEKFRSTLKRLAIPFHVDETSRPKEADWNADGHPVVPVTRDGIADLLRAGRRFLVF